VSVVVHVHVSVYSPQPSGSICSCSSHGNLPFLVTELISFSPHFGRVVSRSCSPMSLRFGNLLKPVKLMTLPFSSLLQCLIGNAAVPPVNAAGNDLAVADLVWGRLRA
jgi:hypothetical protein